MSCATLSRKINDSDRDLGAVKGAIEKKMAGDVFTRVIYTENHDQVGHPPGQNRLADVDRHQTTTRAFLPRSVPLWPRRSC